MEISIDRRTLSIASALITLLVFLGMAALAPARTALLQAAQDVASWSAGALARGTAIASVKAAATLLK